MAKEWQEIENFSKKIFRRNRLSFRVNAPDHKEAKEVASQLKLFFLFLYFRLNISTISTSSKEHLIKLFLKIVIEAIL